jgi:hypothetical protein
VPLQVAKHCADCSVSDYDRIFLPFQPKKGATVAPHNRFLEKQPACSDGPYINNGADVTIQGAQRDLHQVDCTAKSMRRADVLAELTRGSKICSTTRPRPPVIVAELMQAITEGDLRGDGGRKYYNQLRNRSKLAVKTLTFAHDRRPGYRGTWTKSSDVIRPRNPFAMDTSALNYEYDSADDWDGEGDDEGEDVVSGGEDGEDMSEEDSEDDGWLAGDDEMIEYEEGFDADGDPLAADESGDPAQAQAKRIVAKRSQAAANRKRKAAGPLQQLVRGPCWEGVKGELDWDKMGLFKIQFFNGARRCSSVSTARCHGAAQTPALALTRSSLHPCRQKSSGRASRTSRAFWAARPARAPRRRPSPPMVLHPAKAVPPSRSSRSRSLPRCASCPQSLHRGSAC